MELRNILICLYCFFSFIGDIGAKEDMSIYHVKDCNLLEARAAEELSEYLKDIYPKIEFICTTQLGESSNIVVGSYDLLEQYFDLTKIVKPLNGGFTITSVEGYEAVDKFIIGSDSRSTLDGVYALLEKLGYGFYLTHDVKPLKKDTIDFEEWSIEDYPQFEDRIVFNWHNFLTGCTGWNYPEWKSWIEQSSKMRYNSIMIHAYANNPMFQFEMNGIKKSIGYMNTSNSGRDWSGEHVNDVRLLPGGGIFDSPVLGADIAKVPDEERVEATTHLMQKVFREAKEHGMKVIFALDCDTKQANPQEIVLSLPEKARFKAKDAWIVNPEVPEGYLYYKKIVSDLLNLYPEIDKLALWMRGEENSSWRSLTSSYLPPRWQKEYAEFLKNEGRVTDNMRTCGAFALGKMVKAYQKALIELGRGDIEVMVGSWRWDFVNVANYTMPTDVTFIPLDYNYVLDQAYSQYQLSQIGDRRKLVPVIWAHHDDSRYVGRSYRPYSRFSSLLKKEKAKGFGVIHWTNVPHDLFFKNIIKQVWSNTEDEDLEKTIGDFVRNEWNTDNQDLRKYFYQWATEAPMFGRETTDIFLGYENCFKLIIDEFGSCEEIIKKCEERLAVLNVVNRKDYSNNTAMVEYMKGLEHFYIRVFEDQKHINKAHEALNLNDIVTARQELLQVNSENVIDSYVDAIRKGSMTSGEKAIVFTMGTRYYPYVIDLKQQAGIAPVRFKLAKTKHDDLAQMPGVYTWFIDEKKELYSVLGKKEIGQDISEAEDYISLDKPIKLDMTTFFGHALPEGKYEVFVHLRAGENAPVDIYTISGTKDKINREHVLQTKGNEKQIRFPLNIEKDKIAIEIVPHQAVKLDQVLIVK